MQICALPSLRDLLQTYPEWRVVVRMTGGKEEIYRLDKTMNYATMHPKMSWDPLQLPVPIVNSIPLIQFLYNKFCASKFEI